MSQLANRMCQTCKHFEPSPVWKRGWCRNTLLYAPAQSHPVDEDDLDCSRGMRDFWEPAGPSDRTPSEEAGQATVKMPNTNPLRLFSPLRPRLAPVAASNGMMFASAGGGQGGGVEPVRGGADYPDDVETPTPRGNRGDQGNIPAGRQRTIHFQPEERYWTDYLRIALPVIGLVLMLGLFWYWASTFIGGPSNKEPVSTRTPNQAVIADTTSTPAAKPTKVATTVPNTAKTPAANNQQNANSPAAQATQATSSSNPATTGGDNQAPNGQQATQPASGGGTFAAGDTVTATDSVNLRDSPKSTGNILTVLAQGDSLTILSGPEQGDNYTWYQVKTSDGTTGWVASDYITKASQ